MIYHEGWVVHSLTDTTNPEADCWLVYFLNHPIIRTICHLNGKHPVSHV